MIVKVKELIGALKATAMFASEDETRPHMNAVRLESVGGSALRLAATDGHTLWVCEIPARETQSDPAPALRPFWNMPLSTVGVVLKALKDGDGPEATLDLVAHTLDGALYANAGDYFSPYEHVLPTVTKSTFGKVIPEFAADYVARCCLALATYGKGLAPELPAVGSKYEKQMARAQREQFTSPPVAFAVTGDMCPALFYSPKFPCAIAIVMPRKGDGRATPIVDAFVDRVRSTPKKATAA